MTPVGGLPADPDVLHDILGLDCTAKHAIRDAEEAGTYAEERLESVIGVVCDPHRADIEASEHTRTNWTNVSIDTYE